MNDSLEAALLLGLLQGILEWLPVSSEGVVAAVHSLVYGGDLGESVEYALWLHAGTVPAALLALRADVAKTVQEFMVSPVRLKPVPWFIICSTIISGIVGLPLLLAATRISGVDGGLAMAVVGAAMLVGGILLLLRPRGGQRTMGSAATWDGVLTGLGQGISVVPGLSRSGLTTAVLLGRGFQGRDALILSFLMSVPVSLAAAVYSGVTSGVSASPHSFLALAVAFLVGLVTVRVMLRLAARLNYASFVLVAGAVMLGGALWQLLG